MAKPSAIGCCVRRCFVHVYHAISSKRLQICQEKVFSQTIEAVCLLGGDEPIEFGAQIGGGRDRGYMDTLLRWG